MNSIRRRHVKIRLQNKKFHLGVDFAMLKIESMAKLVQSFSPPTVILLHEKLMKKASMEMKLLRNFCFILGSVYKVLHLVKIVKKTT